MRNQELVIVRGGQAFAGVEARPQDRGTPVPPSPEGGSPSADHFGSGEAGRGAFWTPGGADGAFLRAVAVLLGAPRLLSAIP